MFNSKYSKLLTVILIIAIITIIGLLIFVAFRWYKTYTTETNTNEAIDQFDDYVNTTTNNNKNNINTNKITTNTQTNNTVIEPNIDITNSTNNNTNQNSDNELTYKGFKVIGKIEIPKTGVKEIILEKSVPGAIEVGIGFLYGAGINQVGNTVLIGHNFKDGTFFSNNKKLSNGDKIYITDNQGNKVTYIIYKTYTTDTNDFDYATRDTQGKREISLSTCTDDTKNRLIIWAKEE